MKIMTPVTFGTTIPDIAEIVASLNMHYPINAVLCQGYGCTVVQSSRFPSIGVDISRTNYIEGSSAANSTPALVVSPEVIDPASTFRQRAMDEQLYFLALHTMQRMGGFIPFTIPSSALSLDDFRPHPSMSQRYLFSLVALASLPVTIPIGICSGLVKGVVGVGKALSKR